MLMKTKIDSFHLCLGQNTFQGSSSQRDRGSDPPTQRQIACNKATPLNVISPISQGRGGGRIFGNSLNKGMLYCTKKVLTKLSDGMGFYISFHLQCDCYCYIKAIFICSILCKRHHIGLPREEGQSDLLVKEQQNLKSMSQAKI